MKLFFVILLTILLNACFDEKVSPVKTLPMPYPNGVTLTIPAHLNVEQTATGWHISTPDSAHKRLSEAVTVSIIPLPPSTSYQMRKLDGREINYQITHEEGGTGGELATLQAWEALLHGYISVSQTTQAEAPSEPDFSLAWTVMEGVKPTP